MRRLDTAILTAAEAVLEPEVIAFRLYPMVASQAALGNRRAALDAHMATLEAELTRLGAALAAGGPLETIVREIKAREARKVELLAARKGLANALAPPARDLAAFGKRAEEVMQLGWMGIARQHPARARALLKKLLRGRIVLAKTPAGLTFRADLHLGALAAQLGFAETLSGTVAEAEPPSRASECSPAAGPGWRAARPVPPRRARPAGW